MWLNNDLIIIYVDYILVQEKRIIPVMIIIIIS